MPGNVFDVPIIEKKFADVRHILYLNVPHNETAVKRFGDTSSAVILLPRPTGSRRSALRCDGRDTVPGYS